MPTSERRQINLDAQDAVVGCGATRQAAHDLVCRDRDDKRISTPGCTSTTPRVLNILSPNSRDSPPTARGERGRVVGIETVTREQATPASAVREA